MKKGVIIGIIVGLIILLLVGVYFVLIQKEDFVEKINEELYSTTNTNNDEYLTGYVWLTCIPENNNEDGTNPDCPTETPYCEQTGYGYVCVAHEGESCDDDGFTLNYLGGGTLDCRMPSLLPEGVDSGCSDGVCKMLDNGKYGCTYNLLPEDTKCTGGVINWIETASNDEGLTWEYVESEKIYGVCDDNGTCVVKCRDSDSDPNEQYNYPTKNYEKFGQVIKDTRTEMDVCLKGDDGEDYLKEFYCDSDGEIDYELYDCGEINFKTCWGGKCTDSMECQDKIDNDGDGKIDAEDPGCNIELAPNCCIYKPRDDSESGDLVTSGSENTGEESGNCPVNEYTGELTDFCDKFNFSQF